MPSKVSDYKKLVTLDLPIDQFWSSSDSELEVYGISEAEDTEDLLIILISCPKIEGNPKYWEASFSGLPFTISWEKLSSRCRFFVVSCSIGDVKYHISDQYIINKKYIVISDNTTLYTIYLFSVNAQTYLQ